MWHFKRTEENPTAGFEALSKVCDLAISAEGGLDIILHGPTLTYENLRLVIDGIERPGVDAVLKRVVFDFAKIEEIPTPWTAVLALLIRFGRQAPFSCCARNVSGQPRSIFVLYRRSSELMRLLSASGLVTHAPGLRRAG